MLLGVADLSDTIMHQSAQCQGTAYRDSSICQLYAVLLGFLVGSSCSLSIAARWCCQDTGR